MNLDIRWPLLFFSETDFFLQFSTALSKTEQKGNVELDSAQQISQRAIPPTSSELMTDCNKTQCATFVIRVNATRYRFLEHLTDVKQRRVSDLVSLVILVILDIFFHQDKSETCKNLQHRFVFLGDTLALHRISEYFWFNWFIHVLLAVAMLSSIALPHASLYRQPTIPHSFALIKG